MTKFYKLFSLILCLLLCLNVMGCSNWKPSPMVYQYEPSDDLLYLNVYDQNGEPVAWDVVGTSLTIGESPTIIMQKFYVPSEYRGNPVNKCRYQRLVGVDLWCEFGIDIAYIRELYVSWRYEGDRYDNFLGKPLNLEKVFIPSILSAGKVINDQWTTSKTQKLDTYIPAITFDATFEELNNKEGIEIICLAPSHVSYVYENCEYTMHKANTAYMFNYEGAPNENYYAIDEFERGGIITKYPYDPYREGYDFGGWYKDEECTQIWDFAVDTLPAPTYDENGDLEYVETRLYAKWDKQQ